MRNYCAKNLLVSCWSQSKKTTWNGSYFLMKPLSMCLGMLTAFIFRYGVPKPHVICEDVHDSPKLSMWCTIGWQTHISFMRRLSHGVSDLISCVWSQSWKNSNCLSFSNRMACHHTGVTMCGHFLTKDFLADGMAVVDQSPVSHTSLVSWPRMSSCRSMWRIMFAEHLWVTLENSVQDNSNNLKCVQKWLTGLMCSGSVPMSALSELRNNLEKTTHLHLLLPLKKSFKWEQKFVDTVQFVASVNIPNLW